MMRGLILNNPPLRPSLLLPPPPPPPLLSFSSTLSLRPHHPPIILSSPNPTASASQTDIDIDMFLNPLDNTYSAHQPRSVILWDLDNKPPRGPPYDAALSLRRLASLFGRLDSFSAYANRHAFLHLPPWVLHQRRQQRHLETLERRGLSLPSQPYLCGVCGRKFPTHLRLKNHFKQLHERERQKKLSRMRSLKGKKRQRYKERFVSNNVKYEEAARQLLTPKKGYGLAAELRRAGVFVKTVEDKPQAADSVLKRQMLHWMGSGVDWLFLVSDDSDFKEMVCKAREADLQTVVVGDGRTALGRHADLWVPWMRVENGEVGKEEVMRSAGKGVGWNGRGVEEEEEEGSFLSARFYEGGDMDDELDGMADEIAGGTSAKFSGGDGRGCRMSAFSEEELVGDGVNLRKDDENDISSIFGLGADLFTDDSEDEEEDYYI